MLVAASDYMKVLPGNRLRSGCRVRWLRWGPMVSGAAKAATSLRDFFEVDAKHIVLATLSALARDKKIEAKVVQQAIKDLGINPEKANPAIS